MSEAGEGRIGTELRGHVWVMRIERPHKRNGFTVGMIRELAAAYSALESRADARVGLLCAAGAHFTAGLQLDQLGPYMARGENVWPDEHVDPLGLRARRRTKPVVVAVRASPTRWASNSCWRPTSWWRRMTAASRNSKSSAASWPPAAPRCA